MLTTSQMILACSFGPKHPMFPHPPQRVGEQPRTQSRNPIPSAPGLIFLAAAGEAHPSSCACRPCTASRFPRRNWFTTGKSIPKNRRWLLFWWMESFYPPNRR